MADILDYIDWRGDLSFESAQFNSVDNLIFSALSYINFSTYVSQDFSNPISFRELLPAFKTKTKSQEQELGLFINKKTFDLFFKAAESKRYGGCLIQAHVQILDAESETQFSATSFTFGHKQHCIAYRGTDDSILGWKEDFNMSFMETIPSQIEALNYFEKACKALRGTFILVGHSKGGNLAIYTGLQCNVKDKKRIAKIYSNDAPGFLKKTIESKNFTEIKERISSFIPEFSIIGLLLNHTIPSQIVESSQTGMMSHDPFSWQVRGPAFVPSGKLNKKSSIIDTTLKNWLSSLDTRTREQFVDSFFEAFLATKVSTLTELSVNWLKHSTTILKTLHLADSKTKETIMKSLHSLLMSYVDVKFSKK